MVNGMTLTVPRQLISIFVVRVFKRGGDAGLFPPIDIQSPPIKALAIHRYIQLMKFLILQICTFRHCTPPHPTGPSPLGRTCPTLIPDSELKQNYLAVAVQHPKIKQRNQFPKHLLSFIIILSSSHLKFKYLLVIMMFRILCNIYPDRCYFD